SYSSALQIRRLLDTGAGADEAEFMREHPAREEGYRVKPTDILALGYEIRRHGKLAGVILAVVIHALMADAAFNGDQIEIDAFGLHFPLAQRLQVIDRKSTRLNSSHGS